jgi:hypothetical protein
MRYDTLRKPLTFLAAAGILAVPVRFSDPVAIYATIDKVVLTPETNPTTIQIWGTFSMSDRQGGDHYGAAVKGYLYYTIDPAKERVTRAEWSDLQGQAGKKTVVGFAAKWQSGPIGRVRCATEAPSKPDVYTIGQGVATTAVQPHSGWPIAKDLLNVSATNASCSGR